MTEIVEPKAQFRCLTETAVFAISKKIRVCARIIK